MHLIVFFYHCLYQTSNHLSNGDGTEDPSDWCVHLKNKALLADIKECVGNITNLEMASASLYYVVSHMPPGADQVAAAEMCYIEAQKWVNLESSEKAQKGLAKVKKTFNFTIIIAFIKSLIFVNKDKETCNCIYKFCLLLS